MILAIFLGLLAASAAPAGASGRMDQDSGGSRADRSWALDTTARDFCPLGTITARVTRPFFQNQLISMDDYVTLRLLERAQVNGETIPGLRMVTTNEQRCRGAGVVNAIKTAAWNCVSGAATGVVGLGFTTVGANVIWINVLRASSRVAPGGAGYVAASVAGCIAAVL